MLYNRKPLQVPACKPFGKHHPESETLCTFEAFMGRVNEMSLTAEQQHECCKSDKIELKDWE
jgi:hypothetical protein